MWARPSACLSDQALRSRRLYALQAGREILRTGGWRQIGYWPKGLYFVLPGKSLTGLEAQHKGIYRYVQRVR